MGLLLTIGDCPPSRRPILWNCDTCFWRLWRLRKILWQSSQPNTTPSGDVLLGTFPVTVFSAENLPGCPEDVFVKLPLGLCQRRWEARLAGQLKALSHSGHLYSRCTIMLHLKNKCHSSLKQFLSENLRVVRSNPGTSSNFESKRKVFKSSSMTLTEIWEWKQT